MPRFLAIFALILLVACSKPKPPAVPLDTAYPVRGTVVLVQPERKTVRVAHEEIVGFMEAMTMEFDVRSADEIAALQPGDIIAGTLHVSETRTELSGIVKTGHTVPPKPFVQAGAPKPGAELPDATLMNDSGTAFRISGLRGKAIVLTFIYTRCPLPDFCPRMNNHFAVAVREFPSERCVWLSITIDPANDTPKVLAEYARQFDPRPAQWQFVTGEPIEIAKVAAFSGLQLRKAGAQLDHNLQTLVVDPEGKVTKVFTGNQWQPSEIVAELKRVLP